MVTLNTAVPHLKALLSTVYETRVPTVALKGHEEMHNELT